MKVVEIPQHGGASVLRVSERPLPEPGLGEVLLRHRAVGLNFIDIYHREGLYPLELPAIPGVEAVGVVEALGPEVDTLKVGDLAYRVLGSGCYAEASCVSGKEVHRLNPDIDPKTWAAFGLKGLTAAYLLHRTHAVKKGERVLIYAASGGVGQILTRWAKALGAEVLGVVGSDSKVELAKEGGCDRVLVLSNGPVSQQLGPEDSGFHVVYDSLGRDTFSDSLKLLRPLGTLASYGNATGPVDPVSPLDLMQAGSVFLTRPTLAHHLISTEDRQQLFGLLEKAIKDGIVCGEVGERSLWEVAQAQSDLEQRRTVGATVLIP